MQFAPVQKVSAYEGIVGQIEAAIASGELNPGDRLPGERRLMETFGVSRATVREALRVLQATGVVDSRPGDPRGPVTRVRSPPASSRTSLSQLARSDGSSRRELLEFRLFLEGSAAFLAARHHTPAQLAEIEARLEDLRVSVEEEGAFRFHERVSAFHDAIRAAAANQLFAVAGSVISEVMTTLMARRIASEEDPLALVRRSGEDGARLVDAIRARDGAGAQRVQISNIYRFYEGYLAPDERALLGSIVDGGRS